MPLPAPANTTCDIYRVGNAPPAAPNVAAVPCRLTGDFGRCLEKGEGDSATRKFTHIMLVDIRVDIRDDYNAGTIGANKDTVYIPDKNGTPMSVIFTEIVLQGTANQHKRVFLQRQTAPYPTNEV